MRMKAEIDPRFALVDKHPFLCIGFKEVWMGLLHRQVNIPHGMVHALNLPHSAGNGIAYRAIQPEDQIVYASLVRHI